MPIVQIYIEGALRAYAVHRWGKPLNFPRGSYEDLLLLQHTRPAPPTVPRTRRPQTTAADSLPVGVVVPAPADSPHSRPVSVALSPQGRYLLCDSLERHLRLDLWRATFPAMLRADAASIGEAIDSWCRHRNIPPQYRPTIVQRFYRLRRRYITRRASAPTIITYGLLQQRGRKKKK